jgi:hypothetical protein
MTQNLSAQALLIIIAPPNLEEVLVDFLLLQKALTGFTTGKVYGHGTRPGAGKAELSMVEQVTGRQQRVQFMLHATLADLNALILMLRTKFGATDLHYILQPMLDLPPT